VNLEISKIIFYQSKKNANLIIQLVDYHPVLSVIFEQYQALPIAQKLENTNLKISSNKPEVDQDVSISNVHFLVHYISQIIEKIFNKKTLNIPPAFFFDNLQGM
jgi:hypothetical protein